jgi:hypothetical protein
MIAPLRNYFLALLVFNLSSCASMQAVDVQDAMRYPPPPGIDIGSLVEVETLDERELRFRVTGMTDQGLDGKYGFIAWENMARLRVDPGESHEGKAAGYLLGALGIIALLALIGSADSVSICSHPPCE